MNRLIFITSLERSGSTLLDITLGRHPQLISFGEVARVLSPHDDLGMEGVINRPCSCGTVVRDCPFWNVVIEKIRQHEKKLSLADRYDIFLSRFDEVYGREFIPIDSSKFINAMLALQEKREHLDLRILYTVRDVRGWISSSRRAEKNKREIPYNLLFSPRMFQIWKAYIRHNVLRNVPFWYPLEWYLRNNIIDHFIAQGNFSVKQLSYERFVLDTNEVFADICKFVGVETLPMNERSSSHIVRGNRMAFDSRNNIVIQYDTRWLAELWPQYESMAWPFVMVKNNKWVYEK